MTELATIGVLGAGTMGAGIAQVAAEAGFDVLVHEAAEGGFERARERIGGFLQRKAEKDELTADEATAALGRISRVDAVEKLGEADLVVEAIPEDLELKRDAFRRLDASAGKETILATNTSCLSVARIAAATARPERVVGMHFFNPVPLMALVEVIAGPMTQADCSRRRSGLRRAGEDPGDAADTPGFIVNRVARPYYLEAMRIVGRRGRHGRGGRCSDAGVGFRMGPFELIDTIGADVNLAVSQGVFEQFFFDPRYRRTPPAHAGRCGTAGPQVRRRLLRLPADGPRGVWDGSRGTSGPAPGVARRGSAVARILATIVERGCLGGCGGGRHARGDRHRHAAGSELSLGSARVGRADRAHARGWHAGHASRRGAGRPLSGHASPPLAGRAGGSFFAPRD